MTETRDIVVRGSEIATWRFCGLLHQIQWKELWAAPEESYASDLGTAWHLVAGVHYLAIQAEQRKSGKLKLELAAKQNVLDAVDAVIEHRISEEMRETIDWMYDGHIEHYGFDEPWEVLHVEEHKIVPWPDEWQPPGLRFLYSWTSDLVVRAHDERHKPAYVIDNKSTANPLKQDDIDLSDQLGMYTWAERVAGLKVLAPVIRQAKTKKLKRAMTMSERFAHNPSYRTDLELHNVAREAFDVAWRITTEQRTYSAPDPRTCSWKCQFKDVHLYMRRSKDPWVVPARVMRARGYVQREAVPSGHDQIERP